MKNILYRFSDNSAYNPQFTWAFSIQSRSARLERSCRECGVRENYPVGAFDVSVEGGNQYPDVLGCGEYPFLIVSKAVADDWIEARISSFHTYPVGIAEVQSHELLGVPAPSYFRVEIDGRCQIDFKASGLTIVKQCPLCHHIVTNPPVSSGFRTIPNSWDESPLFRDVDSYPRVTFCTERILELARKNKRSNFRFELMESPFDAFSAGVDYL